MRRLTVLNPTLLLKHSRQSKVYRFVLLALSGGALSVSAQQDWHASLSKIYMDDVDFQKQPVSKVLAELNTLTGGKPRIRYLRSRTAREPQVTVKQELTSVYDVLMDAALQSRLYMRYDKDGIALQHRTLVTRNRLQTIILPKVEIKDLPLLQVGSVLSELLDPLHKQLASGARTPVRFRGHRVTEFGDPFVSYSAANVRVDSAIKAILKPLGFEWVIRHDTVLVYPGKTLIASQPVEPAEADPFTEEILPDPPGGF